GDNTIVGPKAEIEPYTVIGSNVIVEQGASIKKSIVWDNSYIGRCAALRGSVVCTGVRIDNNVSIYEGTAVGDNTEIKEFSVLKPDVKIWPHKIIEKGTTVGSSLVWGSKLKKNLFGRTGIPGVLNLDITPEFSAKLGGSYGGTLKRNDTVVITSDGLPCTDMIKSAFISGILSTGVNVYDGGMATTPMSRYAVRALAAMGAVHLKTDMENKDRLLFKFMNGKGVNIDRNSERKIEGGFFLEDFRRAKTSSIGHLWGAPHLKESYIDNLVGSVDVEYVKKAEPKIVISSQGSLVNNILGPILERVGCHVVPVKANGQMNFNKGKPSIQKGIYEDIMEAVAAEKADFGAVIDRHGEELELLDGRGSVVADDLFMVLTAMIIFKARERGSVVVPVNAPGVIEKVAKQYNGQVIRTKTSPQAIMNRVMEVDELSEEKELLQFLLQYDAIYALVKIVEFLSRQSLTLSQLLSEIPEYYLDVKSIHCPWEAKGTVMRRLIDEGRGKNMELLDGVKVYSDNGWALVLPDADEPIYNIYSESFSQEAAESLTDFYTKRISEIIQQKSSEK
ncbi:MAG: nucleotidyltransferase, partial [Clostridia bacterium]|nr:nucleotidyltransferase [Clostridia bacterium]